MDNYSVNASLINENIVEQPLSPVLNKKRYNRTNIHKSVKKHIEEATETEDKLRKSQEKRASSIPIPIKENSHGAKSPNRDVHFKDIKNGFEVVSGKSISTSEMKIREYSNLLLDLHSAKGKTESSANKVKTESDPKIKHLKRDKKFSFYQPIIGLGPHNFEYKLASGDISEESCDVEIKERSQFIIGEDGQCSKLNMLYENNEFIATPHCSKTTLADSVDSDDVLLLPNASNTFNQNGCKIQEVNKSQLNYNVGTDESNSTFDHNIKDKEKVYEKSVIEDTEDDYVINTQETNVLFSNISQLLHPELDDNFVGLNSSKNMVNVNITQSILNTLPRVNYLKKEGCEKNLEKFKLAKFYGFDKENIAQTESKFDKYKSVVMTFDSEINEAIEAIRKKIKANNLDEHERIVIESARKKVKNNCNEADMINSEVIQKKMKKTSPNKAVGGAHNPTETIRKKTMKKDPDEVNSYVIGAVKKKIKNNLDGTKLSNSVRNPSVKKQSNFSKHHQDGISSSSSKNHDNITCSNSSRNHTEHSNPTDDSNSHSSKKSQESDDIVPYLNKNKSENQSVKKKDGNIKKKHYDRKTSSEQSDHSSLKKSTDKKERINADASFIENAPENQNVISLPSNNRVQICIANNRIKINIRSEGDKNKNEGALKSPSKSKNEHTIEALVYSSPSSSKNGKVPETVIQSPCKSKGAEKDVQNGINNNSAPEKTNHFCMEEPQIKTLEKHPNADKHMDTPDSSQNRGIHDYTEGCFSKPEELFTLPTEHQINQGFKTASGKTIEISNKHLKNAMIMYDGTLLDVTNFKQLHTNVSKLYEQPPSEAIIKKVFNLKCSENISNTSKAVNTATVNKALKLENNKDGQDFKFKMPSKICDYGITPPKQNSGFTTASGNVIKISKPVLKNMTKMLEETCFYKNEFINKFQNVNPITSSCQVNIAEEVLQGTTTSNMQSELSTTKTTVNLTNNMQSDLSAIKTSAKFTTNVLQSLGSVNSGLQSVSHLSSQNESNSKFEPENSSPQNSISTKIFQHQSIQSTSHVNSNLLQRKILKPKSLLKSRPESGRPSYLQGGSRKSLHFHDPVTTPSCGDAGMNIVEFGNLETTGFVFASGKNIEIPKEKLEKAMNIFINMEKDVSGIINATNEKENIAQNHNKDSKCSFFSGNKDNFDHNGTDKEKSDMGKNFDVPKEIQVFDGSKKDEKQESRFLLTGKNIDLAKKQQDIFDNDTGISKNQIEKGYKFFGDIENDLVDEGSGFSRASGQYVDIPKESLKKSLDFFGGDLKLQEEFPNKKHLGFAFASGKNVNISKDKITKAMNVFKDIDRNLEELENAYQNTNTENKDNQLTIENTIKFQKEKNMTFENKSLKQFSPTSCNNEDVHFEEGLSFTSGENEKGKSFVPGENENLFKGFACASGKNIEISQGKMEKAMHIFNNIDVNKKHEQIINQTNLDKSVPEILQDAVSAYTSAIEKCSSPKIRNPNTTPERRPQSIKKHLGMLGRNNPINISQEGLERGKQIFKDFDFNLPSPVKNSWLGAPQCSTPKLKTPHTTSFQTFNLTPIKTPKLISQLEPNYKDSTIIFHEKSCNNFKQLQTEIDNEYEHLRKKLVMLEERKNELVQQKALIDSSADDHKRPKTGVLLQSKTKSGERVPLKNLFNSGDESVDYFNVPQHILDITSKNAEDVHFNLASESDSVSIVKTSDGAVIIPSSANTVGVTEINNAFQAMKGVDPKLLPNGWVHNHHKWIVWKLASYERKFPQYFKDCLSLENIIQQLKYRYDIEIDRAKRPALRRIYEKDDVPQKRMVLCISDIIQLYSNKFDLELTDGWYSIKTMIDKPLCQQIYRNKIKIGTKLIIQGAELLNCENGTHPLEASDVIRLKICYNGTRRAHWYTQLGYYKYATPFPVNMSSLSSEGGPVSFIKMYIARVYPVRYIENLNNVKIWRNGRAEEKRANEFDVERTKQIEAFKDKACNEYQKEKRDTAYKIDEKNITKTELSTINCPKTLYNLIQSSSDPESLIEMLTQSQQRSVMEYKQNLNVQRQHEISMRISKQIEELKLSSRNVTPILKLVVMDACENKNTLYVFNVWRPSEEHLQMLKEDTSFSVYNVTFGKKGELHSSSRTYFRQNSEAVKIKKPERQLLPIAMTVDNYYKPIFDEFDTVGLIVQISIQEHHQDMWVADFNGRLLYITIMNGPTICCLLDNLNRGQTVSISNLTKKSVKHDFGVSIANECTVISQYPSQKYLQKGLKMFNEQLPMNLDKLLTDCDIKIENYKKEVDFMNLSFVRNTSLIIDKSKMNDAQEDGMENNATIPSQLTMTDVAMSLIDIDQFT